MCPVNDMIKNKNNVAAVLKVAVYLVNTASQAAEVNDELTGQQNSLGAGRPMNKSPAIQIMSAGWS